MKASQENIMQGKQLFRRFCDLAFGGLPYTEMLRIMLEPLNLQPFEKWAIDFVGPINLPGKCTGARYIITVTEYLTIWAEAKYVKDCSATRAARFIFDDIINRFGCPKILMSDQGTQFINKIVEALTE
jgi:transposase InsO family protein